MSAALLPPFMQAHEGLGNLDSALQDLMLAVRLEPSNQQAVVAARRMREAAQRQRAEKHSPMAQLLERLQGPSEDTPSEGSSKEGIWKALIGLVAEDAAAALDLHRQGGLGLLWTHVHGKDATQVSCNGHVCVFATMNESYTTYFLPSGAGRLCCSWPAASTALSSTRPCCRARTPRRRTNSPATLSRSSCPRKEKSLWTRARRLPSSRCSHAWLRSGKAAALL